MYNHVCVMYLPKVQYIYTCIHTLDIGGSIPYLVSSSLCFLGTIPARSSAQWRAKLTTTARKEWPLLSAFIIAMSMSVKRERPRSSLITPASTNWVSGCIVWVGEWVCTRVWVWVREYKRCFKGWGNVNKKFVRSYLPHETQSNSVFGCYRRL